MSGHSQQIEQDWPGDAFESVDACLWCGSASLAPAVSGVQDWFFDAVPGAFDFAACEECGSLLLLKRPTPEHLGRAYANYYTHAETAPARSQAQSLSERFKSAISGAYIRSRYAGEGTVLDAALGRFYRLFASRRREIDVHYRFLPAEKGAVLDYGCGNGTFLQRAKALGHRVFGVDFDPGAIAAAAEKNIEVVLPDAVDQVIEHGPFDHVSAAHVIEHVEDPRQLLSQFRWWMKPGGTLFLELPNAKAAGLAQYGAFWRGLEAPRHFSLPTRTMLREALEQAGFGDVTYHRRDVVAHWLGAESAEALQEQGPTGEMPAADAGAEGEEEFLTLTARAV